MNGTEERERRFNIVGYNLLAVVIYVVILKVAALNAHVENNYGAGMVLAYLIGLHLLICLVMRATSHNCKKQWLLSAGLVLLVGFSACATVFTVG